MSGYGGGCLARNGAAQLISIRNLTFTFEGALAPLFSGLNLDLEAGKVALLKGATGSGKSTFLRAINGLVPHYSGGSLQGSVMIDGHELLGRKPHDLAHLVGYVPQQAEASFVAETVEEEIAFVLEQAGVSRLDMQTRVQRVAKSLEIEDLLPQRCVELSGGQQQRVAIAAALAGGAQVLLLDEPTSELDPATAQKLIGLLDTIAHRNGVSVIVAEHKFDRLLPVTDTVISLDPAEHRVGSPMTHLVHELGWDITPKTAEEARAHWVKQPGKVAFAEKPALGETLLGLKDFAVANQGRNILTLPKLELRSGEVLALIGPNGVGKSSTLWDLMRTPKSSRSQALKISMIPQSATDLLVLPSVGAELQAADRRAGVSSGTADGILESLGIELPGERHPRDLSAGQQLGLVLAIQLSRGAQLVFLDEPTRGLDYQAKANLARILEGLARAGIGILLASHDMDFVAEVADEVIQLGSGKVVNQGPASSVLAGLGVEAPLAWQVTGRTVKVSEVAACA